MGPYEIVAGLGAGGMGEVYRARDLALERDVAIKVLPAAFASDPERLARFEREAKTLAALNHPHIAQIHGVERTATVNALVMEFVDGQDLAARIAHGPIAIADAIPIARQIAEALEMAHEQGIVHRDLKPANVKVTASGVVKVLDFGLAKTVEHEDIAATITSPATMQGVVLGTAAYMSPEQARGKTVDKRADIWAFGVLLFEMLTGYRPFEGDTVSDTLVAVLTREVDLARLPPTTPPAIRTLVSRCLERDVTLRLRDIGEARIALSDTSGAISAVAGTTARVPKRRLQARLLLAVAVLASVVIGGRAMWSWSRAGSEQLAPLTVGIDAGVDSPLAGAGFVGLNWIGPAAVLSPDGRMLVFIARGRSGGRWQLYVRRLDDLIAKPVAGTEGAYAPFFSPDGASLGFFSGGRLLKVELSNGTITPLATAEGARGGAWSEDGSIVFAPRPDGPLYRVAATGGAIAQATTLDAATGETTHRWPQFLPGGRTLMFTAHGNAGVARAGDVIVQTGTERRTVHRGGLFARYSPSGHLLYVNAGKLFAARFDASRSEVTAPGVAVADDIAYSLLNGTAQYSLSNTGLLAYRRGRSPNRMLLWMDPSGQMQTLRNVAAEYQEARISPDGTRLLLGINDGTQSDVWIYALARDAISRLTFYADNDWSPIWSPDGRRVAYSSWQPDVGTFNLFVVRADGSGEPQRLTTSRNSQNPIDWYPSGQYILFSEERRDTGSDLMLLPIDVTATGDVTARTAQPFLATASNENAGEFSPDGKWVAYTSDESGRNEVYVRPFPTGAGRWQVSTEGAEWVEWRRNGQLFYGISEDVVMRVPYRIQGTTFIAERPQVWMRIPPGVIWVDPSTDGNRGIVIRADDARSESVVLVVNFFEHLRRTTSR